MVLIFMYTCGVWLIDSGVVYVIGISLISQINSGNFYSCLLSSHVYEL